MGQELAIRYSFSELEQMAGAIAESGILGVAKKEQALVLLLLAQAEGVHPMCGARDYHIITVQNITRPSMKAETMLSRFMANGGIVEWREYSEQKVVGFFVSPGSPKGVEITWTIEKAAKRGLTKNPLWSKFPEAMLRSRVASEGVSATMPGVKSNLYTPEEVSDFEVVDALPERSTEPPIATPNRKRREPAPAVQIGSDPVVAYDGSQDKPVQEPMKSEPVIEAPTPAPVVEVLKDPSFITPLQEQAVKKCWAELRTHIQKGDEPVIWKAVCEKFDIDKFDDLKQNQLTDFIMSVRAYFNQNSSS
jgi:hypothetical protein